MLYLLMEMWHYIKGYEGLYEVSITGKVKSLGKGKSTNPNFSTERLLNIKVNKSGYTKVKLFKNGERKYFSVHRLVAVAFCYRVGCDETEVNHKDGDKLNNNAYNLEWCTSSYNQKHAFSIGLQSATKGKDSPCSKRIKQLTKSGELIKEWDCIKEACRELKINSFGIIKCCKKQKKYITAYGYKWEYV